MVRKINKSRLNEMRLEISDATPHNVLEPSRTKRRKNMLVGYARTSTSDQTAGLEAQNRDLIAAGCERVFGDVLTVTKPDRLEKDQTSGRLSRAGRG